MRGLVAAVLALAVVWSAYWGIGAWFVGRQAEQFFARFGPEGAEGLVATRDDLAMTGFPNRFDLTVNGLHLTDPATGYGWDAPFVQVFALTYRPWHLIVAFPPEQGFRTPFGDLTLAAGKLQASLRARPLTALPLERLQMAGTDLDLRAAASPVMTLKDLRLAFRALDGSGRDHEIGLEISGLEPDPTLLAGAGDLPARIDRLRLDADLTFDAPIDRFAMGSLPGLTGISLHEALLVWGDVTARVTGRLVPDANGLAQGSLTLRLTQWRKLLEAAVGTGLLKPGVAQTWDRMIGTLARSSGDPETVEVALAFDQGRVRLGLLPLGPAPRLR